MCLLNESTVIKNESITHVDLGYKVEKPLYISLKCHYWFVYLFTLAYSNGHSSSDLTVPETKPPKITLFYMPPVPEISSSKYV